MDGMMTLEKVLAFRWDAPYRFIASILGVAATLGAFLSFSSLQVLAWLSDWLGWPSGAGWLLTGREWLVDRGAPVAWIGVALLTAGVLFAHRARRGGATAWIGVALCSEAGNFAPYVVLALVLVAFVLSRVFIHFWNDDFTSPEHRAMGKTIEAVFGSLLYVIAAPASWALTR